MPDLDYQQLLNHILAHMPPDGIAQYCFTCGSPDVSSQETTIGEIFVCKHAEHRNSRAFIFDGNTVYSVENGMLIHETVGAIVQQNKGGAQKTLLFLRRKFPYLYTIPAGHMETNCSIEDMLQRELYEETGLLIDVANRIWNSPLLLHDPCRRGGEFHRWHVFNVKTTGHPRLSDEGRIIGWYTDEEIVDLAIRELLTKPVLHFFEMLGYL